MHQIAKHIEHTPSEQTQSAILGANVVVGKIRQTKSLNGQLLDAEKQSLTTPAPNGITQPNGLQRCHVPTSR